MSIALASFPGLRRGGEWLFRPGNDANALDKTSVSRLFIYCFG